MALEKIASTVTPIGILVCGGWSSSGSRNDCYEYSSNSWKRMPSMTVGRHWFDMIYLKGKVYAIGFSMEIFDSTRRTWTKQSMPFSGERHCITQLSANQFILIGGRYISDVSKNVMKKKYFYPKIPFFTFHYVKNFYKRSF